jgi:carbonic anhydrase/acetyltransferase-like protein (isoleucine patch superfamily)
VPFLSARTDTNIESLQGIAGPSPPANHQNSQFLTEEMKQLLHLIDRISSRVNVNLQEFNFNVEPFINASADLTKMLDYYASYAITARHPLKLQFKNSNIAGSYFLGKCIVNRSVVYKSDVRGDELKRKGETMYCTKELPLVEDEVITIRDSFLFRTLIHSKSHNLETPEEFFIRNTVAAHFSNIHGSTIEGCYLGVLATVDHMSLHSCIVGDFSYVQAEELFHRAIKSGTVWIANEHFSFQYTYPGEILKKYVALDALYKPTGLLIQFVESRKAHFDRLFESLKLEVLDTPQSSTVNRFALIKGKTRIGENVLICQRAYLENAEMGIGSNAQENTYIIHSKLSGYNVTAHGAKIIHANLGEKIFVAFNCFLNGKAHAKITIGRDCIIMPHTIIDAAEPITIPANHLVWGFIGSQDDLKNNAISLDDLLKTTELSMGSMVFHGDGKAFAEAFKARFEYILELNGAYFAKGKNKGHAQSDQSASFNMIQPYRTGPNRGMYPTITIEP